MRADTRISRGPKPDRSRYLCRRSVVELDGHGRGQRRLEPPAARPVLPHGDDGREHAHDGGYARRHERRYGCDLRCQRSPAQPGASPLAQRSRRTAPAPAHDEHDAEHQLGQLHRRRRLQQRAPDRADVRGLRPVELDARWLRRLSIPAQWHAAARRRGSSLML